MIVLSENKYLLTLVIFYIILPLYTNFYPWTAAYTYADHLINRYVVIRSLWNIE